MKKFDKISKLEGKKKKCNREHLLLYDKFAEYIVVVKKVNPFWIC
jgi:hypothetical protein